LTGSSRSDDRLTRGEPSLSVDFRCSTISLVDCRLFGANRAAGQSSSTGPAALRRRRNPDHAVADA
jgi:hypothetical protein